jgi:hypothetical protein
MTSLEMTRCPYCSADVACTPHAIILGVDPRIQVLANAGYCRCGFAVLTPCALIAIDDIARLLTPRDGASGCTSEGAGGRSASRPAAP